MDTGIGVWKFFFVEQGWLHLHSRGHEKHGVTVFGEGLRGPNPDAIGMRPTKAERVCMDSLLEGRGFEPAVPREVAFVSPRQPDASQGGSVSSKVQPTGDQAIGILFGHLDDAVLADRDMPA
jgi:hypothetical protein